MFLEPGAITLYTSNGVEPEPRRAFPEIHPAAAVGRHRCAVHEQLERNAEDDDGSASGMGFLTMLNDYGVKIAWNFSTPASPVRRSP